MVISSLLSDSLTEWLLSAREMSAKDEVNEKMLLLGPSSISPCLDPSMLVSRWSEPPS